MVVSVAVAAATLAAAAALATTPPAPVRRPAGHRPGRRRAVAPLAVAALVVVVAGSPGLLLLMVIVLAATLGAAELWRSRLAARRAEARSARVLESCEQLVAELGAGAPPGRALELAAQEWPELAPVAEAYRVGADVPIAWRVAAQRPGAGDLRVVAAAWQVSHRTGEGLADTLDRVARDLRATQATRRIVAGELASARATARLVGVLPVLALTVGAGAGSNPWAFLLGHPVGLGCLALGLTFAAAGLAWIEALARRVNRC